MKTSRAASGPIRADNTHSHHVQAFRNVEFDFLLDLPFLVQITAKMSSKPIGSNFLTYTFQKDSKSIENKQIDLFENLEDWPITEPTSEECLS